MLNFVKDYLAKREGKVQYQGALTKFLADGKLDDGERAQLEELIRRYNLTKEDLLEARKRAASAMFDTVASDKRITNEEKQELESLLNYFGLSLQDAGLNEYNLNKYSTLALIDKGVLPTATPESVRIIFKKDERLHWVSPAKLTKQRKIAEKIQYSGFTASTRITKGLRYRMGSIRFAPIMRDVTVVEDVGTLWLTNQRIGFLGNKKNFSMTYSKILSFDLYQNGVGLHKEGRENPYLIVLNEVEIPAAILSTILNSTTTTAA